MHPARLLVAVDDGAHVRLQKQQAAVVFPAPEGLEDLQKFVKAVGGAHVVNQGYPAVASAAGGAELRELQDHPRRHIVHDIKAHVLQKGGRLALPASGKTGYNQNFHLSLSLSRRPYGTVLTSGSRLTPVWSYTVFRI